MFIKFKVRSHFFEWGKSLKKSIPRSQGKTKQKSVRRSKKTEQDKSWNTIQRSEWKTDVLYLTRSVIPRDIILCYLFDAVYFHSMPLYLFNLFALNQLFLLVHLVSCDLFIISFLGFRLPDQTCLITHSRFAYKHFTHSLSFAIQVQLNNSLFIIPAPRVSVKYWSQDFAPRIAT